MGEAVLSEEEPGDSSWRGGGSGATAAWIAEKRRRGWRRRGGKKQAPPKIGDPFPLASFICRSRVRCDPKSVDVLVVGWRYFFSPPVFLTPF
jgi:hypothetical protein